MLVHYAWFIGNSEDRAKQKRTWPVGSLKPNDFGMFDMYGNANEWCQSRWVEEYPSTPTGSAWEDV
jgi:formylglycine-generating enzyme required for sulfatase activity